VQNRTTFFLTLLLGVWGLGSRAWAQSADSGRIRRDIEFLAHDRLEGRETCTPGNDAAAEYIERRFAELGLRPAGGRDSSTGAPAYRQEFIARSAMAGKAPCRTQNVAAMLRGSDAVLADEYMIIGAHYDHLGRSSHGATDALAPKDPIRNGADDNASGTAAVLELARLLRGAPPRRSVIFVAFSAEEWGLFGSKEFVERALPHARVQAMLNFDMVGRLRDDRLLVFGVGTATEMRDIVNSNNRGEYTFGLGLNPDGVGPSDHTNFYTARIPVLHFFTDTHADYHAATDESSKINAAGTARIVEYAARIARDIADRDSALTYVVQAQKAVAAGSGTRPYLGSIPDMAGSDTPGLRLSGVTPGTPADKGGLKAGDLVVEFGGKAVTDLNSYSAALGAHKPGDTVNIVVVRDGKRVTVTVTLAARGS
jgi:hypothetical protein